MSDTPGGDKPEQAPAVKDRWWVDTGDKKKERQPAAPHLVAETATVLAFLDRNDAVRRPKQCR